MVTYINNQEYFELSIMLNFKVLPLTMLERTERRESSRHPSVQQQGDNKQVEATYLKARSPVSTASG